MYVCMCVCMSPASIWVGVVIWVETHVRESLNNSRGISSSLQVHPVVLCCMSLSFNKPIHASSSLQGSGKTSPALFPTRLEKSGGFNAGLAKPKPETSNLET